MALENVLERIPGLAGYLAKGQYDQQRQGAELGQLNNIAALSQHIQAQQLKDAEAKRMGQLRDVLSSLTPAQRADNNFMYGLAIQHANPHDLLNSVVKSRHDADMERIKAQGGGAEYLSPVAVMGPDGKPAMMQPSKRGGGQLLPGVSPLNNFTANTQDALLSDMRAREQYNSLSAEQRARLPFEQFRATIAGQEHTFNTGQSAGAVPSITASAPIAPSGQRAQITGVPQPRVSFAATPVEKDRTLILKDELAREQSDLASLSSPTPMLKGAPVPLERVAAEVERTKANIAALGREMGGISGVPQSTTQPAPQTAPPVISGVPKGVPLIDNPAVSPKEKQKLTLEKPGAELAANANLDAMQGLINTVKELEKHPGLKNIVGKIDQFRILDWTDDTTNARALQDKLIKQSGINTLQDMRATNKNGAGVGAVSDKEWPILQRSVAALDEAQTPEAYKAALNNLVLITDKSMSGIRGAYEKTYGEIDWKPTQYIEQGPRSAAGKIKQAPAALTSAGKANGIKWD